MTDKKKAILLRIPPDLWENLNGWARDELRSLNAQIEYVLREAVRKRAGGRAADSHPEAASQPSEADPMRASENPEPS